MTEPEPGGHGIRNILIVEDSEPAVIQLLDILHEKAYQVGVARNGKEALARLEGALPDGIILDLMMPEVDGFEFLRRLRASGRTARIPVLILTARQVTREELSTLKGNHIHQLITKGNVRREELLDAVEKMSGKSRAPESPRPRVRLPGRISILAVEDNPDNMTTLRALLRDTGDLTEAGDGLSALDKARKDPPDLILLDLSLPGMDGVRLLGEFRRDARLAKIPVVAVTARAMKGDREEILASGFDGYISKPVEENDLKELLKRFFDGPA